MRFSKYDVAELKLAGQELVALFKRAEMQRPCLRTTDWTELVLDFFAGCARKDVLVEARKPRKHVKKRWRSELQVRTTLGEFASFDVLHSENPRYLGGSMKDYWTKLVNKRFEVLLAVESEWGAATKRKTTRFAVLSDATKLTIVRARSKVMVFGPVDAAQDEQLCDELERLRRSSGDNSPWLLVRQPWRATAPPSWSVLSG